MGRKGAQTGKGGGQVGLCLPSPRRLAFPACACAHHHAADAHVLSYMYKGNAYANGMCTCMLGLALTSASLQGDRHTASRDSTNSPITHSSSAHLSSAPPPSPSLSVLPRAPSPPLWQTRTVTRDKKKGGVAIIKVSTRQRAHMRRPCPPHQLTSGVEEEACPVVLARACRDNGNAAPAGPKRFGLSGDAFVFVYSFPFLVWVCGGGCTRSMDLWRRKHACGDAFDFDMFFFLVSNPVLSMCGGGSARVCPGV